MIRVAISRFVGWLLFGEWAMCCAILDWRGHPARHLLDAVNRPRHDRHCQRMADWEALMRADEHQDPLSLAEGRFVSDNRRAGRL